ncbi:MAG TPA: choice-of-anchor A family protein [Phenylobacterium sp.]|jgi:choice-of-anchor A domain-containing protein
MRDLVKAAATAVVGAALFAPAAAWADTAQDYNLFVTGGMTMHSSDTEGRVAVGGDAALSSYSVGAKASPNGVNLVVGGNLTAQGGSTIGETIVAGQASYQNWSNAGLQPAGTPLPVDFAAETARLGALSTLLNGYAANGSVAIPWSGQYSLTGTSAGLNVFDLDGALLSHTNTLTINLTPGSTALINVSGLADSFSNAGITIIGGDASSILWNFADATSLSFSGINMLGSVLAPNANYTGGWGQLNGQLIVKSFRDANGATQINAVAYKGGLLGLNPASVPEPATWTMMIAGFGAIGAVLRRRRATSQLA